MESIILHYTNFEVESEVMDDYQPYNAISPETHKGTRLMDYDYKIIVDDELISEYLSEQVGTYTYKGFSLEKKQGFELAIKMAFLKDMFCVESLEEDEDFIEWCKDKYEEEAREQCHADYDD